MKVKCKIFEARKLPPGSVPLHYDDNGDLLESDYEVVNLCLTCTREPVCLMEREQGFEERE